MNYPCKIWMWTSCGFNTTVQHATGSRVVPEKQLNYCISSFLVEFSFWWSEFSSRPSDFIHRIFWCVYANNSTAPTPWKRILSTANEIQPHIYAKRSWTAKEVFAAKITYCVNFETAYTFNKYTKKQQRKKLICYTYSYSHNLAFSFSLQQGSSRNLQR